MEYDPKLVDRMVALVRRMASDYRKAENWPSLRHDPAYINAYGEALAIVAELPEPVDPDEALVTQILDEEFPNRAEPNDWAMRKIALIAIRRSRAQYEDKSNG